MEADLGPGDPGEPSAPLGPTAPGSCKQSQQVISRCTRLTDSLRSFRSLGSRRAARENMLAGFGCPEGESRIPRSCSCARTALEARDSQDNEYTASRRKRRIVEDGNEVTAGSYAEACLKIVESIVGPRQNVLRINREARGDGTGTHAGSKVSINLAWRGTKLQILRGAISKQLAVNEREDDSVSAALGGLAVIS